MSAILNLLPDTSPPPSSHQPTPSGHAAPGGHRRSVGVVIMIGLVVVWAASSLLLGLRLVEVVLLGALLLPAFQTLVRRRPLGVLLLRDTASFARGWAGKLLVAGVLVAVPVSMVLGAVAATAGTGTTAGRHCSWSSSWRGATSPRVASS